MKIDGKIVVWMFESSHHVPLDGIAGRVTFETEGLFGAPKLRLDGRAPPRVLMKQGTVSLPKVDGGKATVRIVPAWNRTLPTLEIDGRRLMTGEPIPVILMILGALPLALIGVGGAVGGALGGGALAISYSIARRNMSTGKKATAILAVGASAAVGYSALSLCIAFLGRLAS
jgi:hypothetical protein